MIVIEGIGSKEFGYIFWSIIGIFLILVLIFSENSSTTNLCADAASLGEEALRECIDYYVEAGLTLDQITGKTPISGPKE